MAIQLASASIQLRKRVHSTPKAWPAKYFEIGYIKSSRNFTIFQSKHHETKRALFKHKTYKNPRSQESNSFPLQDHQRLNTKTKPSHLLQIKDFNNIGVSKSRICNLLFHNFVVRNICDNSRITTTINFRTRRT